MPVLYKIIHYSKKYYASWEKKQHNEFLRKKILSEGGVIGEGGQFGRDVNITGRRHICLGNNVHIGTNAFIRADGGLNIGDNTIISRNLLLYTMNHNYQGSLLPFDHTIIKSPVFIGENVWIGMNVTICPGTEIGEGAVIGMGTTVFGKIPPFSIVGSSGWKELRSRNIEEYSNLKSRSAFAREDGLPL